MDVFYVYELKLKKDLPKTDCENLPTRSNIEFLEWLRRQSDNLLRRIIQRFVIQRQVLLYRDVNYI